MHSVLRRMLVGFIRGKRVFRPGGQLFRTGATFFLRRSEWTLCRVMVMKHRYSFARLIIFCASLLAANMAVGEVEARPGKHRNRTAARQYSPGSNSGGCNSYGCWNSAVGSCNSYGCSDYGVCNSYGCPTGFNGSCNSYGCWSGDGGCNSYGCWNSSVGSCNSYGCSDYGVCSGYGCPEQRLHHRIRRRDTRLRRVNRFVSRSRRRGRQRRIDRSARVGSNPRRDCQF